MNKESKIYIAGHHGLVGSAIWNNLKKRGYNNLVGRSHKELDLTDQYAVEKFFDEEKPDAVVLAAAFVGGIMAVQCDKQRLQPRSGEAALPWLHMYLSERCTAADEGRRIAHLTTRIYQ